MGKHSYSTSIKDRKAVVVSIYRKLKKDFSQINQPYLWRCSVVKGITGPERGVSAAVNHTQSFRSCEGVISGNEENSLRIWHDDF